MEYNIKTDEKVVILVLRKKTAFVAASFLMLLFIVSGFSIVPAKNAVADEIAVVREKLGCNSFKNDLDPYASAQLALPTHPYLDRNHDKIACNSLK